MGKVANFEGPTQGKITKLRMVRIGARESQPAGKGVALKPARVSAVAGTLFQGSDAIPLGCTCLARSDLREASGVRAYSAAFVLVTRVVIAANWSGENQKRRNTRALQTLRDIQPLNTYVGIANNLA